MRIRSVLSHSVQAVAEGALIALLAVGLMAGMTFAAKPAASNHRADAPCTISASSVVVDETYSVSVSGLPTGIAINLWITDATGTTGSPIGGTTDGTFNFQESSKVAGTTTYAFSGPTKQNTTVYSTCSVSAN